MLTSLWSNGFLSYVCDVGLWFRFIKYGSTRQKQNLDKIIALRLAISFSLTSADKRCWIDCTDTSLTDSEISDNRSLIIQNPQYKYCHETVISNIMNLGRTQRKIYIYSSKSDHSQDDISDTTLRFIRGNRGNQNLEKNMYLKKYTNKYKCFRSDQSFVWTKKQPRMGNQLPYVLAFKDKVY